MEAKTGGRGAVEGSGGFRRMDLMGVSRLPRIAFPFEFEFDRSLNQSSDNIIGEK
jgi:hypothetical protein